MPIEYDLSKTGPIARGQKSDDPTSDEHIVSVLEGYRKEAEAQRSGGLNPRDAKWKENLDLYWNRWDFSDKADWQAQETMHEVPQFVDRFAAAMKEALIGLGAEGFYTVIDPADEQLLLGVEAPRCFGEQKAHYLLGRVTTTLIFAFDGPYFRGCYVILSSKIRGNLRARRRVIKV